MDQWGRLRTGLGPGVEIRAWAGSLRRCLTIAWARMRAGNAGAVGGRGCKAGQGGLAWKLRSACLEPAGLAGRPDLELLKPAKN